MAIHRKQALSAGRIFTRGDEHYFFTTAPVDVLKMSCADYSNVFLKPVILKLVVL